LVQGHFLFGGAASEAADAASLNPFGSGTFFILNPKQMLG